MALSEIELIQRTLNGDETAFGFLVDKYKGAIHALAYRKLGDFHLAEEITQDTFLKAYQKLSTLKDWHCFPGWLYVIASRLCLMWQRKNRLPTQSIDNLGEGQFNSLAYREYADQKTREKVHDALESLPESERTVLTLHYLAGMTCEEIGRFIGTSRGAILNRLYRARRRLKEEMIPMMQQTFQTVQLPPTFTQRLVRQIRNLQPTPSPHGKPLAPWIAAATLAFIALFVGLGQQQMTRFQRPYSLDAPNSATMVEIVDAPMIEIAMPKLMSANRGGVSNSRKAGDGNRAAGEVLGAAQDSRNGLESSEREWTQTNGPYGGGVTALHATLDGTLFAGTPGMGIFRSTNGGDSWHPASQGLQKVHGMLPGINTFAQKGNTLYAGTIGDLFSSSDGGNSWQQSTRFPFPGGISGIATIGERLYIGVRRDESVYFSDDNGKSWTRMDNGLTNREMLLDLVASGTTLFAKTRDNVSYCRAGENWWTELFPRSKIYTLATSGETVYVTMPDNRLLRSTDEGKTWVSTELP